MKREDWIWMPHAGHFICGHSCRFHLNTYVNGWIVSTVGEYLPDSDVRRILAASRGITIEGKGDYALADYMKKCGFEEIGCDRLYESMVFVAEAAPKDPHESCCPWRQANGRDVGYKGYNDPGEALRGHYGLCALWATRDPKEWLAKNPDGYGPDDEVPLMNQFLKLFDGAK